VAGVAAAGIKYPDRYDLALLVSGEPAVAAGVFTTNKYAAAPVQVSKKYLQAAGVYRGVVVNSGCANACTGEQGITNAILMTKMAAQAVGCQPEEILVASTGVIGTDLPMDKVQQGILEAGQMLSAEGGRLAAKAIMTTDTRVKEVALQIELDGKKVFLGGMAKGSGMIHPNMATMLGFITTDAAISSACLQEALRRANEESFNMVTVDGDTSTNDTVVVLANGRAGNTLLEDLNSPDYQLFCEALKEVCQILAKMIAGDGEGATKLLEVCVVNAPSLGDACKAARAVAGSNLVKAALFGEDANWGRIICALGYSEAQFNPATVDIYLGDLQVARNGAGIDFDEKAAGMILTEKEIRIIIDLHAGDYAAKAWGCDLSYEYVKINADYRS
jgi:glutamate N-acetyltransferase/amino-acid N-acetyltransferase